MQGSRKLGCLLCAAGALACLGGVLPAATAKGAKPVPALRAVLGRPYSLAAGAGNATAKTKAKGQPAGGFRLGLRAKPALRRHPRLTD